MSTAWENDSRAAGTSPPTASDDGGAVATAKQRAGETTSAAGEGAKQVASEAATQARNLAEEATVQAGKLYETSRTELLDQADQRTRKAAQGLRTWSDQLGALATGRTAEAGELMTYVQEAQGRLAGLASRMEESGISGVTADLSSFARRRPLVFLGAAGAAGFVIGRMIRSTAGQNGGQSRGATGMASRSGTRSEVQSLSTPHAELAPPLGEAPVIAEASPGRPVDVPGSPL